MPATGGHQPCRSLLYSSVSALPTRWNDARYDGTLRVALGAFLATAEGPPQPLVSDF